MVKSLIVHTVGYVNACGGTNLFSYVSLSVGYAQILSLLLLALASVWSLLLLQEYRCKSCCTKTCLLVLFTQRRLAKTIVSAT